MTLENHLIQVKGWFLIFSTILFVVVGGVSIFLGSSWIIGPQSAEAGPQVQLSVLEANYKQLESEGLVAGANTESVTTDAKSLPVLVYHGIEDNPIGPNVSPEQFKKQMMSLYQAGWRTISIQDFADFIHGQKTLPDKSFLLTFDDGRKDSLYNSDAVLRLLGYRAVMFVISEHALDSKTTFYLNKPELEYMRDSGRWDLQAHAQVGHDPIAVGANGETGNFISNKLWLPDQNRTETQEEYVSRITKELTGVKDDMQNAFGISSVSYAFPYSDYGQDSVTMLGADQVVLPIVGNLYSVAFAQFRKGMSFTQNYPSNNNEFYLARRITIGSDFDENKVLKAVEAGALKPSDYTEDFTNEQKWIATWGQTEFLTSGFNIRPSDNSTGASVYMDGGREMADYKFEVTGQLEKGQSVALMAHYQNDDNYLACVYTSSGVSAVQRINGTETKVASWNFKFDKLNNPNTKFAVAVQGTNLSCYINNGALINTPRISDTLDSGSVGIKIWDQQLNNAFFKVQGVTIVQK